MRARVSRVPRGEGAVRSLMAEFFVKKVAPLLIPWAITYLVLPLAAAAAHARWGADPWLSAASTLTIVIITAMVLVLSTAGPIARWHNTLSAAAALSWLTAAIITGPWDSPTVDVLLWVGGTNALLWSIRIAMGATGGTLNGRPWGKLAELLGLEGSRLETTKQTKHKTEALLQLPPGEKVVDDVISARRHLASALQIPPNGVRINQDPDRADRAHVSVVNTDLLRETHPWPGPAAPGQSIAAAPIPAGMYEDAEPAVLLPINPAKDFALTHTLATGTTGSGKSEFVVATIADLITRTDVLVWACDAGKFWQTYAEIAPGLDWYADDKPTALALIAAVKNAIPGRAKRLGAARMKQWRPEAYTDLGMPFIVLFLDESADLIPDNEEYEELCRKARSVGIWIVTVLQQARFPTMSVEARGMLGTGICFGVHQARDAVFTLSDDLIEGGAAPELWKDRRPGLGYLDAGWVDDARRLTPFRAYLADDEQVRIVAAYAAANRPALEAPMIEQLGDAYKNRRRSAGQPPAPSVADNPVSTAPTTPLAAEDPDSSIDTDPVTELEPDVSDEVTDALDDAGKQQLRAAINADPDLKELLDTDPEPDLHVDLDDEIPDDDVILHFSTEDDRLDPAAAAAALRGRIDELATAGKFTFGVNDVVDIIDAGHHRGDVLQALDELEAAGRIVPADDIGAYHIREPETHELESV